MNKTVQFFAKNSLYFAWIVTLVSSIGSFYFSDILNLAPCILCWYQRILMFPLVIIIAVAIGRKESKPWQYILPFSIAGMVVAFYHYLLQYGIIPENAGPCKFGISCTEKVFELFNFITIPLMSFAAFAMITILLLIFKKYQKHEGRS